MLGRMDNLQEKLECLYYWRVDEQLDEIQSRSMYGQLQ